MDFIAHNRQLFLESGKFLFIIHARRFQCVFREDLYTGKLEMIIDLVNSTFFGEQTGENK